MLRHMRRALLQRRVTQGARLRTRQFVQMHSESNHMEESLSRHSTGLGDTPRGWATLTRQTPT